MSVVLGVRKQTTLLSPNPLRDFVKIPNEWTASVGSKDICRSGPAIFPREEKIGTEIQNCRYFLQKQFRLSLFFQNSWQPLAKCY